MLVPSDCLCLPPSMGVNDDPEIPTDPPDAEVEVAFPGAMPKLKGGKNRAWHK